MNSGNVLERFERSLKSSIDLLLAQNNYQLGFNVSTVEDTKLTNGAVVDELYLAAHAVNSYFDRIGLHQNTISHTNNQSNVMEEIQSSLKRKQSLIDHKKIQLKRWKSLLKALNDTNIAAAVD